MPEVIAFRGREAEIAQVLDALAKKTNVLVTGRAGIGKSALLRQAMQRCAKPGIWMPANATSKQVVMEVARQAHAHFGLCVPAALLTPGLAARAERQGWLSWENLERTLRRLPIPRLGEIAADTLRDKEMVLFVESLEIPPTIAHFFVQLLDAGVTCAAAMDDTNHRVRIEKVTWRFPHKVPLGPLPLAECREIAREWVDAHPIRFSSERVETAFISAAAQDSRGIPAALMQILEKAREEGHDREVTPAAVRQITTGHDAAVSYFDMTPFVLVAAIVFVAMKFVGRGMGDAELWVLSGVAGALFMVMRVVVYELRRR